MARIEVEIEDYLDEVDTKYLIKELKRRKKITDLDLNELDIPEFKTPELLLSYIKRLLHIRPWHDKERIISEINDL